MLIPYIYLSRSQNLLLILALFLGCQNLEAGSGVWTSCVTSLTTTLTRARVFGIVNCVGRIWRTAKTCSWSRENFRCYGPKKVFRATHNGRWRGERSSCSFWRRLCQCRAGYFISGVLSIEPRGLGKICYIWPTQVIRKLLTLCWIIYSMYRCTSFCSLAVCKYFLYVIGTLETW